MCGLAPVVKIARILFRRRCGRDTSKPHENTLAETMFLVMKVLTQQSQYLEVSWLWRRGAQNGKRSLPRFRRKLEHGRKDVSTTEAKNDEDTMDVCDAQDRVPIGKKSTLRDEQKQVERLQHLDTTATDFLLAD